MANWITNSSDPKFKICIPKYLKNNYFTQYEIIVHFYNDVKWVTLRRYSEFKTLDEKLVKLSPKYKVHFPPKKTFNNTSDYFLDQRRKSLEIYMNEIVCVSVNFIPRDLAYFLEMEKYEIHGITTNLAKYFFQFGSSILKSAKQFEISIINLYSISQRLQSAAPTNLYQRPDEDFGNVLDIVRNLESVQIVPSTGLLNDNNDKGTVLNSNIVISRLTYDISVFSSVKVLKINGINISNMKGLYKMNSTTDCLQVHHCLKSLNEILLGDLGFQTNSIDYLKDFKGPWRSVTTADFSYNSLTGIDACVVTLQQVHNLNLAHNQITSIDFMNHLTFLTTLDLSHNNLSIDQQFQSLSSRIGGIKRLILSHNKLSDLTIIDRMFSLEYLDISNNKIKSFSVLLPLCRLICLEQLEIRHNPICCDSNFFPVLFDLFLDKYENVRVNGVFLHESPLNIEQSVNQIRQIKYQLLINGVALTESPLVSSNVYHESHLLLSISVPIRKCQLKKNASILNIPIVHNSIVHWLFNALGQRGTPGKVLWCTEVFSPNKLKNPQQVLLVSSNSSVGGNLLKCILTEEKVAGTDENVLTICPEQLISIEKEMWAIVVGAEKCCLKLELSGKKGGLFLSSKSESVEGLMSHLFHVDEGLGRFGDPRIVYTISEDHLELMRRFVDLWRFDLMSVKSKVSFEDVEVGSDLLFVSRAMFQMRNRLTILLTVVVTSDLLCLIDERLCDFPHASSETLSSPTGNQLTNNRHRSFADVFCVESLPSSYSSSSHINFQKVEAFFLNQIVCLRDQINDTEPLDVNDDFLSEKCPIFSHLVQVEMKGTKKEPIRLYFESSELADKLREQVNSHSVNELATSISVNSLSMVDTITSDSVLTKSISQPSLMQHQIQQQQQQQQQHYDCNTATDVLSSTVANKPKYSKYFLLSFQDIKLNISLYCPKLLELAQKAPVEILNDFIGQEMISSVIGLIWTPFVFLNYEAPTDRSDTLESPGLLCITDYYIYLASERSLETNPNFSLDSDSMNQDYCSEPEADQQAVNSEAVKSKLLYQQFPLSSLCRIFIGLYNQWIVLSFQSNNNSSNSNSGSGVAASNSHCDNGGDATNDATNTSEAGRLILLTRNSDLNKRIIRWLNKAVGLNQSIGDGAGAAGGGGGTGGSSVNDVRGLSTETPANSVANLPDITVHTAESEGDLEELKFEIRQCYTHIASGSMNPEVDICHFTSLDSFKYEKKSESSDGLFVPAAIITKLAFVLMKHNIIEYPVPIYGQQDIRKLPDHKQFKVCSIIPLVDCLQIQLPGHDHHQMILVVRNSTRRSVHSHLATHNLQLSLPNTKEQKILIDRLRQCWANLMQADTPLRVSIC